MHSRVINLVSAGILTGVLVSACGARSSLPGADNDSGTSTSTGIGGTGDGTSTSTGAGGTGGLSTSSGGMGGSGGGPVNNCAQPGPISVVWTVSLEALGLFATDMAVDPGGDIYISGPGPFIARFDGQGNLQWVAGQPLSPPFAGEFARITLGPDKRMGLITESGLQHDVIQNGMPQLLGELPGWFDDIALGPAGRVYASDMLPSKTRVTAMDETLSPIWSIDTTLAIPIGRHLQAGALGRVLHAGGYSPDYGYTTFGGLDPAGTSVFSTHYPEGWGSMMDLELTGDDSALVLGVANQGASAWLERFTPEGALAWYAESGFCGDNEEMWSCGMALLPSGDTWTCIAAAYFGTTLSHFSAEGALVEQMTGQLQGLPDIGFGAIHADPSGRVIALHDLSLSALIFP